MVAAERVVDDEDGEVDKGRVWRVGWVGVVGEVGVGGRVRGGGVDCG